MKTQSIEAFLNSLPPEVLKVKIMEMGAYNGKLYVGLEQYNEIQETIKKYPEHFPIETAYNKVPKEVHSQYQKEVSEAHERILPRPEAQIETIEGEGFVGHLERWSKHQTELAKNRKPFDPDEFWKQWDANQKKEDDFKKAKKKLWKKHYGKFKIPFQDF